MTSSAANNAAAIAAAIKGADEHLIDAALQTSRRSISLKHGGTRGTEGASFGQEASSVDEARPGENLLDHDDGPMGENEYAVEGSAIVDGHTNFGNGGSLKARARRASEGSHLSRREGKRASGEVRCEKCGKGYKHSSCLTKHLLVHPSLRLCALKPLVLPSGVPQTQPEQLPHIPLHTMALIDTDTGGSIRPNGHTPPSYSFPSINRCSCSRRLRSWLE